MSINSLPEILYDIKIFFENNPINISPNIEGEGRGGSLIDEGSIKRALQEHNIFNNYIIDVKPRKFGDIIIKDYDNETIYVVNIKTSIGSTDNCFSKAGMVWAFTNLELDKIPSSMNLKKMIELIDTYGEDIKNRDYWYMCIDKNNPNSVIIRGAKQISNWVININPSNILQVNWKKEKLEQCAERSWKEAYDIIIGGAKKSTFGFIHSLPEKWLQEIREIE